MMRVSSSVRIRSPIGRTSMSFTRPPDQRAGALPRRWIGGSSRRLIPLGGDAVHDSALAHIVVDRLVHSTAIVPQRERIGFPPEAARIFRLRRMLVKIC